MPASFPAAHQRVPDRPGAGLATPENLRLPFPIAAVGLDSRRMSALEMALTTPRDHEFVIVDSDDGARAVILDLDSVGAEEHLAGLRRRLPRRPLILVALRSVAPEILGPDVQLLKPIQVRALMDALAAARSLARAWALDPPAPVPAPVPVPTQAPVPPQAPVPTPAPAPPQAPVPTQVSVPTQAAPVPRPAVPAVVPSEALAPATTNPIPAPSRPHLFVVPNEPPPATDGPAGRELQDAVGSEIDEMADVLAGDPASALPATHYDPGRYLQGLVTQACQAALARDQAVHIDGLWPTITLLPSTGTAILAGGQDALAAHAGLPDLLSSARLTFTPAPRFSPNHPDAVPLDALLWQLALAASHGRLPVGTPVDQVCALREWPNFTRLAPAPGAMGIAALWTQEPLSLLGTAEALRLAHSEVFAFFSGARALGLIVDDPQPAPPPSCPAPVPVARPGLLRRALSRLRVG